jgi:hypothetical protein
MKRRRRKAGRTTRKSGAEGAGGEWLPSVFYNANLNAFEKLTLIPLTECENKLSSPFLRSFFIPP